MVKLPNPPKIGAPRVASKVPKAPKATPRAVISKTRGHQVKASKPARVKAGHQVGGKRHVPGKAGKAAKAARAPKITKPANARISLPGFWGKLFGALGMAKTSQRHVEIDKKMVAFKKNFVVVPKAEAEKMHVGDIIPWAVEETMRSGNEVGFVYDTATKQPVSSVKEGTGNQVNLSAKMQDVDALKAKGRLGFFHTHPIFDLGSRWHKIGDMFNPRVSQSRNDDAKYATTFSTQDYQVYGGSDEMGMAVPRAFLNKYSFFKSKGTDNDPKLHADASKAHQAWEEHMKEAGIFGEHTSEAENAKAISDVHRFQHEMGVSIEQVPAGGAPKDFQAHAAPQKLPEAETSLTREGFSTKITRGGKISSIQKVE